MERHTEKLPGLQIARFAAAMGIAYFHSWHVTMRFPPNAVWAIPPLRDHGWISVDFFFAISGFVICMVTSSPRFNPVSFMVRRAFRLYPLWIATSFMYWALTDYVGRGERQTADFFYWSLTLLPTDGFPFYDLGWSLQHELAFYLLACITVPLFGFAGLISVLCVGVIADHALTLPWYAHQYFSYYGNFLAGIAAFLAYRRAERFGAALPITAGLIALWLAPTRTFYPIGLFCWLIGFVNLRASEKSRIANTMTLLGDASYSIYLIHPLVLNAFYVRLDTPGPAWSAEPWRYGALYLTCVLAVGSWMMFERPMIWIGNQIGRSIEWIIATSRNNHPANDH